MNGESPRLDVEQPAEEQVWSDVNMQAIAL
jgi:hypothetical protein